MTEAMTKIMQSLTDRNQYYAPPGQTSHWEISQQSGQQYGNGQFGAFATQARQSNPQGYSRSGSWNNSRSTSNDPYECWSCGARDHIQRSCELKKRAEDLGALHREYDSRAWHIGSPHAPQHIRLLTVNPDEISKGRNGGGFMPPALMWIYRNRPGGYLPAALAAYRALREFNYVLEDPEFENETRSQNPGPSENRNTSNNPAQPPVSILKRPTATDQPNPGVRFQANSVFMGQRGLDILAREDYPEFQYSEQREYWNGQEFTVLKAVNRVALSDDPLALTVPDPIGIFNTQAYTEAMMAKRRRLDGEDDTTPKTHNVTQPHEVTSAAIGVSTDQRVPSPVLGIERRQVFSDKINDLSKAKVGLTWGELLGLFPDASELLAAWALEMGRTSGKETIRLSQPNKPKFKASDQQMPDAPTLEVNNTYATLRKSVEKVHETLQTGMPLRNMEDYIRATPKVTVRIGESPESSPITGLLDTGAQSCILVESYVKNNQLPMIDTQVTWNGYFTELGAPPRSCKGIVVQPVWIAGKCIQAVPMYVVPDGEAAAPLLLGMNFLGITDCVLYFENSVLMATFTLGNTRIIAPATLPIQSRPYDESAIGATEN